MAKKRALQKNTQSIVITVVVLIASLAILGAASIITIVNQFSDTVATVNGEKVTKPYFNFLLYDQKLRTESQVGPDIWDYDMGGQGTMEDSAKSNAYTTAVQTKIMKQQAGKSGIALSEEDNTQIDTGITETKTALGDEAIRLIGLNDAILKEIITDQILSDKLYEDITKDVVVNPEEFETYFQDYMTQNYNALTQIDADVIHTNTAEEAAMAKAEIDGGADFIEVLKRTSLDYDNTAEYTSAQLTASDLYPQDLISEVLLMLPGDVSEVIESVETTSFYVVRLNNIVEPDEAQLRPIQEETYLNQQKQTLFQTQMTTWEGESDIKPNQDLLAVLSIAAISPPATPVPSATPPAFDPLAPETPDGEVAPIEGETATDAPTEGETAADAPAESETTPESSAPADENPP
ncbi:MAG: SurA N-terminal domain-containing protein, partial [Clostridiales bacterium]|nr:SurA N-terminal domain-containing protein [Clostridiales bacterium]